MAGTTPQQHDPELPPGSEELQLHDATATRSLRNGVISLAIAGAMLIGIVFAVPGLHGVAKQVTRMPVDLVVAAVLLEALSCLGYVLAFLQVFDRAPVRFGARVALTELAFGAAVSLGGAGSVAVGAWLLVERGGSPSRVAERSAVLFLLTSAINVITLAAAGLGLWLHILPGKQAPLFSLVPGVIGVATFVGVLALPALTDRLLGDRRGGKLLTLMRSTAGVVRSTRKLLFSSDWRTLGAVAYLWFDISVLVVCFAAVGPVPPLSTIVLVYQIGYLSNFIPIPGGVGVLDGSFVGLFVLYGGNATRSVAATVVYHAISLWVPVIWGTVAFMILRRTRGQPVTLRPPREERSRVSRGRG